MTAELAPPPAPRLSLRSFDLTIGWRTILQDVSFDVGAGELVGVLGPNGSGKSSLIRILIGLTPPSRGTIWLDGRAIPWRDRALRAALGVVFQEPSLDPSLTAAENLALGARLFGIRGAEARQRVRSLLDFMELADRADDYVRTFSGGMRRRLELARALIHSPSILVLDEPTTGLDPHAVERTWKLLLTLKRSQGLTALVSTHSADEAAKCDRLVLMDRGRVIAVETPDALMARVSGEIITLETPHAEQVAEDLREHMQLAAHVVDGKVVAEADAAARWIPRIAEAFPPGTLTAITMRRPSLADAFMKLTGRTLEEAQQQDVLLGGEVAPVAEPPPPPVRAAVREVEPTR